MKKIDYYLKQRICKIQEYLRVNNIDSFLVTDSKHLFYLTNYSNEDALVIITPNDSYYLIDSRSYSEAENSVISMKVLLLNKETNLKYYLDSISISSVCFEANNFTVSRLDFFKKNYKSVKFIKTKNIIEDLRIIKDEYEISQISKACSISSEVFKLIETNIKKFKTESEVSDFFLSEIKKRGATNTSFSTIVANGVGSSIPHYTTSYRSIDKNKITLIDFGCVYNGYCSDCTRVILPENYSEEIIEIYDHVKKAKSMAINLIKPGVKASLLDKDVRKYFDNYSLNKHFTHSLGHSVGLNVHDGLSINEKSEFILEESMILTIEPGLYFDNKFGIRLEDTVLVTKNGCKILT